MLPRLVPERQMGPSLDRAIRDALCACFSEDAAVFRDTRAWHGSAPAYSVVLEDGKSLLAHVGVVDRTITVGPTSLRVAGIQNVLVLPPYRGRGLADVVMTAAIDEARRRGFDAGLLFCIPELEKVYARTGWVSYGNREVVRVKDGVELPLPGKNVTMFKPLQVEVLPDGLIHLRGNDW